MKNNLSKKNEDLPRYIFIDEIGGVEYYRVYICHNSKLFKGMKAQKKITKILTLKEAIKLKEKWNPKVIIALREKEFQGCRWGSLVEHWEAYWKKYPSRKFGEGRRKDHVARAKNWTQYIWDKPASKVTIGDCKKIIQQAYESGASKNVRKEIKGTLNSIFEWAMQEDILKEMRISPAKSLEILCADETAKEETRPEILNRPQITELLTIAEKVEHSWFPVWFTGAHGGFRTSELEALRKESMELVPKNIALELNKLPDGSKRKNYGFIHVRWAWKTREKLYGPPKAKYWRSVPVNEELYWFLIEYIQNDFGKDELGTRVFPELSGWKSGRQAEILRTFCEHYKLFPPENPESSGIEGKWGIKFHTLRAIFATQMLSLGIAEDIVMKIGGWSDPRTMRIYVRQAGILEQGATQGLKFKSDQAAYDPSSPYHNVDYRTVTELIDDEDEEEYFEEESNSQVSSESDSDLPINVVDFSAFKKRANA